MTQHSAREPPRIPEDLRRLIYQVHPNAEPRTSILLAIETMLDQFDRQGRTSCAEAMIEDEKKSMIEEIALRQKRVNRERLSVVGKGSLTIVGMLLVKMIAAKLGINL